MGASAGTVDRSTKDASVSKGKYCLIIIWTSLQLEVWPIRFLVVWDWAMKSSSYTLRENSLL